MRKTADWIGLWLFKKSYIQEKDIGQISFALEVVINNFVTFSTIALIGFITKNIFYTLLFLFVFIGFRTIRDQYHADTFLKCYTQTIGLYLFCISISHFSSSNYQPLMAVVVTTINVLMLFIYEVRIKGDVRFLLNDKFIINYLMLCLICYLLVLKSIPDIALFLSLLEFMIAVTSVTFIDRYD